MKSEVPKRAVRAQQKNKKKEKDQKKFWHPPEHYGCNFQIFSKHYQAFFPQNKLIMVQNATETNGRKQILCYSSIKLNQIFYDLGKHSM